MPTTRRRAREAEENEDAWEDVEEMPQAVDAKEEIIDLEPTTSRPHTPPRKINTPSSRTNTPRKRRLKTVYVAAPGPPPKKVSTPPSLTRQLSNAKLNIALHTEPVYDGSIFLAKYALDVLKTAINLLRKPLAFLVFLWMFAMILARISHTIRAAFSPLCYLPGISKSALCLPDGYSAAPGTHQSPKWADYPTLVDVQSATIEQLLDESTSGSALALQIKKAEMATTDLVTLVRVSELKSRDILGDALRQFVDDARTTGRSLNKLHAKVTGAVDGIMAVNDYALRTIEDAHSQPPPSILHHIIPWSSKPKTDFILSTFEDSMNYLSLTMSRLIIEFELNLQNLNKLEEQLSVLHELVSREDTSLSSAKAELLSELWTKVGGNRRQLRGYEHHLHLLKGLGLYRKQALAHVVGALHTLAQMSEDIESLRERVSAPELAGGRIPVEVHIRSIQNGLERLNEGRSKAKLRESEAIKTILGSDA